MCVCVCVFVYVCAAGCWAGFEVPPAEPAQVLPRGC